MSKSGKYFYRVPTFFYKTTDEWNLPLLIGSTVLAAWLPEFYV